MGFLEILNIVFISALSFSSSKLTYMVELPDGQKQIALSAEDGRAQELITEGKRWHLYPRLSADGSQIVYSEGDNEKNLGLFIRDLRTHTVEQWVDEKGQNLHGKVSGDGRYLVFSGPISSKNSQIGIIDLFEGRKKGPTKVLWEINHLKYVYSVRPQVIKSEFPCYFPAISSDGAFVVFQRDKAKGNRDIVSLDIKSGTLKQVSDPSGNSMSPSLSFDDRNIAFTSNVNGNWDVYLYDRLLNSTDRVTNNPAMDFAPSFGPDNSIVFASDRGGHFQIQKISKLQWKKGGDDSSYVHQIISGTSTFYAPSLSGDFKVEQQIFPKMPAPPRSSFGAIRVKDKVYIVGGHQGVEHDYPQSSFTNRVDIFDLNSKTWSQGASRNFSAHGFGLAANGKYIYAFGGFTYSDEYSPKWTSLDAIERYDTELNTWKIVGHLPHKRSSNVVAQVGSLVYLIGGWDSTPRYKGDFDGTFHDSIDVFDLRTEKAAVATFKLPSPLRRAFSAVVSGEKIILIGGIGQGASHFKLLDTVTALDTQTGSFSELKSLPFGTFAPAAGVLNGAIYVFGGMFKESDDNYSYVNHVFKLSLKGRSWEHTGRYLSEDKAFSQVIDINERSLGLIGGHNDEAGNGPVGTFEIFSAM